MTTKDFSLNQVIKKSDEVIKSSEEYVGSLTGYPPDSDVMVGYLATEIAILLLSHPELELTNAPPNS